MYKNCFCPFLSSPFKFKTFTKNNSLCYVPVDNFFFPSRYIIVFERMFYNTRNETFSLLEEIKRSCLIFPSFIMEIIYFLCWTCIRCKIIWQTRVSLIDLYAFKEFFKDTFSLYQLFSLVSESIRKMYRENTEIKIINTKVYVFVLFYSITLCLIF